MGLGQGYPIADEAFDFELFKLAGTFAASSELVRLGKSNDGISRLRAMFEQSDASRRLIAVAVMVRSKLDSRTVLRPNQLDEIAAMDVGSLVPDLEQASQTVPLAFREACNKIIHATSLDLTVDAGSDESESDAVLSLTVTLWGARSSRSGAREWHAELDVPRFIQAASRL
jgi:hypothetical protein